jgi:hypothetical protein
VRRCCCTRSSASTEAGVWPLHSPLLFVSSLAAESGPRARIPIQAIPTRGSFDCILPKQQHLRSLLPPCKT